MTAMLVYAAILGVLFIVGFAIARTQKHDSWSAGAESEGQRRDSTGSGSGGGCGSSCGGCGGCGG